MKASQQSEVDIERGVVSVRVSWDRESCELKQTKTRDGAPRPDRRRALGAKAIEAPEKSPSFAEFELRARCRGHPILEPLGVQRRASGSIACFGAVDEENLARRAVVLLDLNVGEVRAPKLLRAELFDRELKGQSKALLVSARDTAGEAVTCITKLDARLKFPPTEHLREWLGCALGTVLGIHVPIPYRVQIEHDFASGIPDPRTRADAEKSLGVAFGCSVFNGATQWLNAGSLPADLHAPAAELLAFDMFIHNVDRRAKNHNVMVGREEVLAFDHGDAFAFIFPNIGAPPAAEDPLTEVAEQHVFRSALRGIELPLSGFYDAVKTLTDDVFEEIRANTPAEWQNGPAAGKLEEICDVLRARRDSVHRWLPIVEQWVRK